MPRGLGSNLPGEKAKGLYFKQIQFIKNLDSGSVSACLRWSCLSLGSGKITEILGKYRSKYSYKSKMLWKQV